MLAVVAAKPHVALAPAAVSYSHTEQSYGAVRLAHSVPIVAAPVVAVHAAHVPVVATHVAHAPAVAIEAAHVPVVTAHAAHVVEAPVLAAVHHVPASINYGSSHSSHLPLAHVVGHAPAAYSHSSIAHGHSW